MDDSLVLEIYSFSYDRVIKKAGFLCIDCLLLSRSSMNSGCFILFLRPMSPGYTTDGRFNPHKPLCGFVQQSLSEI